MTDIEEYLISQYKKEFESILEMKRKLQELSNAPISLSDLWEEIPTGISRKARLENRISDALQEIQDQIKRGIRRCPKCLGKGEISQGTSYQREERRIQQIPKYSKCPRCQGKKKLEIPPKVKEWVEGKLEKFGQN